MGATEKHIANIPHDFSAAANDTKPKFFRQPQMLQRAREMYRNDLYALMAGEGEFAPYHAEYTEAMALLKADCGTKMDRSGEPMWFHAKHVADDAFCTVRMLGFTPKEAATVYVAMLHHDSLEPALKSKPDGFKPSANKTLDDNVLIWHRSKELARRQNQLSDRFNHHDRDIPLLVLNLTKIPEDLPYLTYIGSIGRKDAFSQESTPKAGLAAWVGKFSDSSHNRLPERTMYLEDWRIKAIDLRNSGKDAEADKLEAKIAKQDTRQLQYDIVVDFMAAKIDGIIPPFANVAGFLCSKHGRPFMTPKYISAIVDGLGEQEAKNVTNHYNQLNPGPIERQVNKIKRLLGGNEQKPAA